MARPALIGLEDAQRRALTLVTALPVERVALRDAAHRWAAEDIIARRTQPERALSAMDGYAVRHKDAPGPWRVTSMAAAGGALPAPISPGEAARIFTGAPLPDGADAVIMQEDITRTGDTVSLATEMTVQAGKHVRQAGEDFRSGQMLISRGAHLTPAAIALAAMAGHDALPVHRKVRIALVSTGDELVPPGEELGINQIPASNAVMLAALLSSAATEVTDLGIVRDDRPSIARAFAEAAANADLVISTGGASVGDHDHVKPALEMLGAALDFWKIAMRPGKPLMAGQLGSTALLGLPGNPVSAFVTAILFARPMIAAMAGASTVLPARAPALLTAPLPAVGQRTDHVRGIFQQGQVTPIGLNDSAALHALSLANVLIVRPEGGPAAQPGDPVEVIRIA